MVEDFIPKATKKHRCNPKLKASCGTHEVLDLWMYQLLEDTSEEDRTSLDREGEDVHPLTPLVLLLLITPEECLYILPASYRQFRERNQQMFSDSHRLDIMRQMKKDANGEMMPLTHCEMVRIMSTHPVMFPTAGGDILGYLVDHHDHFTSWYGEDEDAKISSEDEKTVDPAGQPKYGEDENAKISSAEDEETVDPAGQPNLSLSHQ